MFRGLLCGEKIREDSDLRGYRTKDELGSDGSLGIEIRKTS